MTKRIVTKGRHWVVYSTEESGKILPQNGIHCFECFGDFRSYADKEAHYLSRCTPEMHRWHIETDYYSKAGRFPNPEQYQKHEAWLLFEESGQDELYGILNDERDAR